LELLIGTHLLAALGFDLVKDGGEISLLECHEIPNNQSMVTPSPTETEALGSAAGN